MSSTRLSKTDLTQAVLKYLNNNKLMALATSWQDKSWSATVFFAYDNKLNLLFYSKEDTRHCQNIEKNPFVSVAVNQDWGTARAVKGLQLAGQAEKIAFKDHKKYYGLYKSRYPWADEFPDHTLYIIKPSEIWYIDQKLFGHFYRVRVI